MLVSITERCSEGCSHCFVNSLPGSPIMSEKGLEETAEFLVRVKPRVLLMSGGELTEHPEFVRFVERLLEVRGGEDINYILSNGSWFFDDERRAGMERLLAHPKIHLVQVRTHIKFYPNYRRTIDAIKEIRALSPKIEVFSDGITLFPLGRARANHMDDIEHKMPGCANLFLIAKQGAAKDFTGLLHRLEMGGGFCKPFVSSQGKIHAGETPYCEVIGRVTDTGATIMSNILTRCKPKNTCGLVGNLPPAALAILATKTPSLSGATP